MKKLILMGLIGFTILINANDYFNYSCDNKKFYIHHNGTVFDFARFNGRIFYGKGVEGNMFMFENTTGTRLRFLDNSDGDTLLIYMTGDVNTTFKCLSSGNVFK